MLFRFEEPAGQHIYAGIEYEAGSEKARKLIDVLVHELCSCKIRFPATTGIGIKPVSCEGTERRARKAILYAIDHDKPSVTVVHKDNVMKFTEGSFRDWSYALAQKEFGAEPIQRRAPVPADEPAHRQDHHGPGLDRRRLPTTDPDAAG